MEKTSNLRERKLGFPIQGFIKNNYKLLTDWMSGLVSGFVSVTVCAPLDLARTRQMLIATTPKFESQYNGFFNTLSQIYRQEGIRGLYSGYSVTAMSVPIFNSLYFSIFYHSSAYFKQNVFGESNRGVSNIVSAVFTGFICNTLTNPLWVVRTRIQSQYLHDQPDKYKGLFSGMWKIYREEGFRALYKGLFASYVGLSHPAILYPVYEKIKEVLVQYKGKTNALDHFFASLLAKILAMVSTYPHVVIRTRLQDLRSPKLGVDKAPTEWQAARIIVRETMKKEGIRGLFSGLRFDLVRCLPANSIIFVVFEFVKKEIEKKESYFD
jgi:solute carrier family 25 (mitochondrial folate transporter), member 32